MELKEGYRNMGVSNSNDISLSKAEEAASGAIHGLHRLDLWKSGGVGTGGC